MTTPLPRQAPHGRRGRPIGGFLAHDREPRWFGRRWRARRPKRRPACDHCRPRGRGSRAARSRAAPARQIHACAESQRSARWSCSLAALRLWSLADVPGDPFYDAAVRSMPLSLHNFLLGAYEPGGSLSVDKPPLDLWLQVLTTQVLGFTSFALKLPPALAGTAAVAVLYDAVRRVLGGAAGIAAALALAALPIAMLTARSDTMDSVAMLLSVVALWLLVRFAQDGRSRWCYLAAAAMGLAFNVKLFEGLVALPALLAARCARRAASGGSGASASAAVFAGVALVVADPDAGVPGVAAATRSARRTAVRGTPPFVFNGYDRSPAPRRSRRSARRARQPRPANQQRACALGRPDRRSRPAAPVRPRRAAVGSAAGLPAACRARARRAGAAVSRSCARAGRTRRSSARSPSRYCCGC